MATSDFELNKSGKIDNLGQQEAYNNKVFHAIQDVKSAISANGSEILSSFPSGGIIMWSGSIATIPDTWYLCDGNNGTPDLRDKFVIGAKEDDGGVAKTNVTGVLTQSGGNATKDLQHTHADSGHIHTTSGHILSIAELPSHSHTPTTGSVLTTGGATAYGSGAGTTKFSALSIGSTGSGNSHTHGNTGSSTSSLDNQLSTTEDILNPYYALAFIMKA